MTTDTTTKLPDLIHGTNDTGTLLVRETDPAWYTVNLYVDAETQEDLDDWDAGPVAGVKSLALGPESAGTLVGRLMAAFDGSPDFTAAIAVEIEKALTKEED